MFRFATHTGGARRGGATPLTRWWRRWPLADAGGVCVFRGTVDFSLMDSRFTPPVYDKVLTTGPLLVRCRPRSRIARSGGKSGVEPMSSAVGGLLVWSLASRQPRRTSRLLVLRGTAIGTTGRCSRHSEAPEWPRTHDRNSGRSIHHPDLETLLTRSWRIEPNPANGS